MTSPMISHHRAKRITLILFLVFGFLQGIGNHLLAGNWEALRLFSLVCMAPTMLFIVRWFVLDAREQNYVISKRLLLMLAFVAIIGAPYYFFKTRGRKKCRVPLVKAVLFLLALGLAMVAGEELAKVSNARERLGITPSPDTQTEPVETFEGE